MYAKASSPKTRTNPGSPVRTLWRSSAHASWVRPPKSRAAAAQRARDAAAQALTDRREREAAVVLLGEHAHAREQAQDTIRDAACVSVAFPRSPACRGPSASRSAMPSVAATQIARDT